MAYENIRLSKPNMAVHDGYFYMMDETRNVLFQKLDDGETAFVYPLSHDLGGVVSSLEFDGINFWTMQTITDGVSIKRWKLENYTCNLLDTFNFSPGYVSSAFTTEHYHDTLASGVNTNDYTILLTDYTDTIVSGSQLTLGPDATGLNYEDVDVVAVSGSNIILSSGVLFNYPENSNVNFYTNLWVFNSTGDGTLHKINARTGDVLDNYTSGTEYDNITACTFFKARGVKSSPVDSLIYVKGTTLKYLNVDDMTLYGIMTIDNSIPSPPETLVVYDLALEDINIYRLQIKARYFGTNHTWATYNYVLSTTRRFVDTINVSVYPVILPANAINTSKVTAIVNDQYGDGVWEKPVYFTDDDPVGFITTNPTFTDNFFGTGAAVTYYKAGTSVRLVTIEGTATQFD